MVKLVRVAGFSVAIALLVLVYGQYVSFDGPDPDTIPDFLQYPDRFATTLLFTVALGLLALSAKGDR
ncbi:hypothetical protein FZ934_22200 (plasmid) [Rhizobium grahamii]|uniref:Uncharacterized protein n=1 Tax=Rhizobium grahamii TaxID=1120045 RepID=A0A5Q0CEX0_9HYPH|nr:MULTISPECIES: hypothetical protein [Rhizobium]QFY63034.1 hypothetical protein FZ934_22200 [Rhizobium grahamii]QRM52207.1 hypothetical protein F3Y33_23455 [Rhizobium sp. BG6]